MGYTPEWLADQQPSTWRGIPIVITAIEKRGGRRVAVHEYPFYDYPWIQDLGQANQEFSVEAFIWGDDVADQQDQLDFASDQTAGPGEWVHTTKGSLQVNCIGYSTSQTLDGNMVGLRFTFVSIGPTNGSNASASLAPFSNSDTQGAASQAALETDSASSYDFFNDVGSTIHQGVSAIRQVTGTINSFTSQVRSVVGDATRAVNAVNGLASVLSPGVSLGRYNAGNLSAVPAALRGVNLGLSTINRVTNGTNALLSAACAARTTVGNSISNVSNLLGDL